ncbi:MULTISPECIES: aldehyde dehydrogenase family protein [Actinomadura]|uniref:Aldehyde dehydrogenase family protein n=1 Tax=Actinomadura geliboluensis TaxID=882440 RepID=A0A5S4HBR3_9ACTN|nr:aldehyde dehydrogenase family protein [Actinomadura geliboluensis]TMR42382.1 aldehyde dehydrogenase family protein [Actinomadura geliboluensis]
MTITAENRARLLEPAAWRGKIYVGGGWCEGGGADLPVLDKSSGDTLAEVGTGTPADVARATAAANEAQPRWAGMPAARRREVFIRAAGLVTEHHEELADWLLRETGGIRPKVEFELFKSRENLLHAAATTTRPVGEVLPAAPGVLSIGRRVPRGVVGIITPWNFPFVLALRTLAPALAAGNAAVLKPNPHTPVTGGVLLAKLFEEAGLPPGVLQVVPGDGDVGQAIVTDPGTALISFTGSTPTGRRVAEAAAPLLKKCVLELGGNNAYIVLDDADVDAAASAGAFAAFMHQGQVCMTAGKHIVHRSVAEEYAGKLAARARSLRVGDPAREEGVNLGPIVNQVQIDRVQRIVDESVAAGAALLTGGGHEGPFFEPTVLGQVTAAMPAYGEEIFGPVAPVIAVDSDEEAIALANEGEYGLTAAVRSGSESRGAAVADRLRSGVVHVNDQTIAYEVWAPFGGMGASGNGDAFGGPADADAFTEWQWITRRSEQLTHSF